MEASEGTLKGVLPDSDAYDVCSLRPLLSLKRELGCWQPECDGEGSMSSVALLPPPFQGESVRPG